MMNIDINGELNIFKNPAAASQSTNYPNHLKKILDIDDVPDTVKEIKAWPGYTTTPLHQLNQLANDTGVAQIWYKDESTRFNLGSFKALGGAYAVSKQIIQQLDKRFGIEANIHDLLNQNYKDQVSQLCVSCATDGNHGRSVAWGAQLFGCECIIYIHKHVSRGRELAIAKYGAKVVRIDGNYDDSVKMANEEAHEHGRVIVSDTSYPGYMDVPKDVAMGYTVMLDECFNQLRGETPTHIFIQGGVGGLASSVCAYAWQKWGKNRPTFVVVEPVLADCLLQSAKQGQPVVVEGDLETMMAGLACGEVSLLAWDILSVGTDYFSTVTEDTVAPLMNYLATLDIQAGESAVAGLAAMILAAQDQQMNINHQSKVLLIGTEGATDPVIYEQLTGIKVGA